MTHIEVCASPVFIIGAPRSGTSVFQFALREHPALWGGPESDLITLLRGLRAAYDAGRVRGRFHWLSRMEVTWEEYLEHVGHGINSLYMSRSQGMRWVEQTPEYTLYLNDLSKMFPKAQYLLIARDGRQVVHSLRNFVTPQTHEQACRTWRRCVEAALAFSRSAHADRVHTVLFSDLIQDTEVSLRKIYAFLGLPYEPKSVAIIREKAPINSSFKNESSSDKLGDCWASWTMRERRRFQEICGDLMSEIGFEEDASWIERAPHAPGVERKVRRYEDRPFGAPQFIRRAASKTAQLVRSLRNPG